MVLARCCGGSGCGGSGCGVLSIACLVAWAASSAATAATAGSLSLPALPFFLAAVAAVATRGDMGVEMRVVGGVEMRVAPAPARTSIYTPHIWLSAGRDGGGCAAAARGREEAWEREGEPCLASPSTSEELRARLRESERESERSEVRGTLRTSEPIDLFTSVSLLTGVTGELPADLQWTS